MNESKTRTVNRLPVKTWNHLKMNEAEVALTAGMAAGQLSVECSGEVRHIAGSLENDARTDWAGIPTGMGEELDTALEGGSGIDTFIAEPFDFPEHCSSGSEERKQGAGVQADGGLSEGGSSAGAGPASQAPSVRMKFCFGKNEEARNQVFLHAKENSTLTVVMDFCGGQDQTGTSSALIRTKILAERQSLVRLVQIHRAGNDRILLNDVGAVCREGARLEVIQVVLSGRKNYIGFGTELEGNGSSLSADVAYNVENDHSLDLLYRIDHLGRHTESSVNALGVLRDEARKTFRGVIDFRKGCAGSVGNEKEDVLLIGEKAENKTIPLILCAEEDVEGNHGATIGGLDDAARFYLESRGLSPDQVTELAASGRIASVIRRIPDDAVRHALLGEEFCGKL